MGRILRSVLTFLSSLLATALLIGYVSEHHFTFGFRLDDAAPMHDLLLNDGPGTLMFGYAVATPPPSTGNVLIGDQWKWSRPGIRNSIWLWRYQPPLTPGSRGYVQTMAYVAFPMWVLLLPSLVLPGLAVRRWWKRRENRGRFEVAAADEKTFPSLAA